MVKYVIRKYIIEFNENVRSKISANRMHVEKSISIKRKSSGARELKQSFSP